MFDEVVRVASFYDGAAKGDGEDEQGVELEVELAFEFFGVRDATSDAKEEHKSNGEQERPLEEEGGSDDHEEAGEEVLFSASR